MNESVVKLRMTENVPPVTSLLNSLGTFPIICYKNAFNSILRMCRYCINNFIKNCIQFQIYYLRQIWKAALNVGVPTLLSGNVRAKFSLFSRQGLIPTTLRHHYLRFPLRHPMSACRASLKTIVPGSPSFSRTLFPSHIYFFFFLAINS